MQCTICRIGRVAVLPVVVWGLVATLALAGGVAGQGADWRSPFAAGEAARREGDHAAYARLMAEAGA